MHAIGYFLPPPQTHTNTTHNCYVYDEKFCSHKRATTPAKIVAFFPTYKAREYLLDKLKNIEYFSMNYLMPVYMRVCCICFYVAAHCGQFTIYWNTHAYCTKYSKIIITKSASPLKTKQKREVKILQTKEANRPFCIYSWTNKQIISTTADDCTVYNNI